MKLPNEEDVIRMKNAEKVALDKAQNAMREFEVYVSTMSMEARANMDPENDEVIRYVEMRDKTSSLRVNYETLRSERASAEPMLRYQDFMKRQRDGNDMNLVQARYRMAEINYLNALMGEYEAMSVMMIQGPQALEQYDQAKGLVTKWREEFNNAQEAYAASPDGMLNPMSMNGAEDMIIDPGQSSDDSQTKISDYTGDE
jgi:hypothetical protein